MCTGSGSQFVPLPGDLHLSKLPVACFVGEVIWFPFNQEEVFSLLILSHFSPSDSKTPTQFGLNPQLDVISLDHLTTALTLISSSSLVSGIVLLFELSCVLNKTLLQGTHWFGTSLVVLWIRLHLPVQGHSLIPLVLFNIQLSSNKRKDDHRY